jgi:hypothetical protein
MIVPFGASLCSLPDTWPRKSLIDAGGTGWGRPFLANRFASRLPPPVGEEPQSRSDTEPCDLAQAVRHKNVLAQQFPAREDQVPVPLVEGSIPCMRAAVEAVRLGRLVGRSTPRDARSVAPRRLSAAVAPEVAP